MHGDMSIIWTVCGRVNFVIESFSYDKDGSITVLFQSDISQIWEYANAIRLLVM